MQAQLDYLRKQMAAQSGVAHAVKLDEAKALEEQLEATIKLYVRRQKPHSHHPSHNNNT